MKVNALGMLMMLLLLICSTNFVLLSAVPLSDEQIKPEEIASTQSSTSNETASVETTNATAAAEKLASENASVENTSDTLPPLVFPSDDNSSKNETALKILQSVSSQDVNTSEEISKSTETAVNVTSSPEISTNTTQAIETSSERSSTASANGTDSVEVSDKEYDNENQEEDEDEKPSDVEIMQDNNEQLETELEEQFAKNGSTKATINMFDDQVTSQPAFHNGHFALMFAGILVVLSLACYAGLVLWRNKLENRYGMRQRLVTEDDYYNNNDVRFFGL